LTSKSDYLAANNRSLGLSTNRASSRG